MKLHANAALTPKQRAEVKALYESGRSVKQLSLQYQVHESTIRRWIKRDEPWERSSAPHQRNRGMSEAYREASVAYRQAYPQAGAIRIATALRATYPQANRGSVQRVLQAAGLTRPVPKKNG